MKMRRLYYKMTYVIVLEKRSNFAVKLIFQYEPLKLVTLVDFVHNPECLN